MCEDYPSCDKPTMRLCLEVVPRHVGDIAALWVLHTSFKGTQAQYDLPPQDHKLKGKGKLQEEIDAFEEAPKALVKWVPKTASSSTSSSTTTTPRIPMKMMWIPKKKN